MGRNEESDTKGLRTAAVDSVTSAITRGHKRRSGRRDVAGGEIQIGPTTSAAAEQLADPDKQLQNVSYHKRRRVSLIPEQDGDADDDSNDEWEEHVDMDTDAVEAALAVLEKDADDQENALADDATQGTREVAEDSKKNESEMASIEEDKKARARLRAAALKRRVIRRHSLHILLSIANLLRLDKAADDEDVCGFALSVTPGDIFLRKGYFGEDLSRLGLWLRTAYEATAMIQHLHKRDKVSFRKRLCSAPERAISCATKGSGDIMDIAVVVAALVRSQGYRCRIVTPVQPVSHHAPKMMKSTHKVTGRAKVVEARPSHESEAILYSWVEIWCPDSKKWTPLDICEGFASGDEPIAVIRSSVSRIKGAENVDVPLKREKQKTSTLKSSNRLRPKSKDPEEVPPRTLHPSLFTHVVAVEKGVLTDVTRRYTRNWIDVGKARARGRVFERILERFQSECPPDSNDDALKLEIAEFDALAADEAIPTSLSALQKHPRYILERHLKRYEVIHPRWPIIGYFKEEPIFLRSKVHLLHTKDRWIRQMREVMEGATPLKSVKSKNGTDDKVDLYGEWQTMPLIIPESVDGKVPRGVHGNVDLWTPEHLPKGTVHINLPYAKMAARKIGVEFAPAMTGFDLRGGRPIPKIEGVVVATENADLIRDAARSTAQAARERQQKRAREEAREREEKAMREARARDKVKKRYGGLFDDVGSYEAVQKREGLRRAREEKFGKAETDATYDGKSEGRKVEKVGSSEAHEHEYGKSKHVKGDTWKKTCMICGLDVSFEKF